MQKNHDELQAVIDALTAAIGAAHQQTDLLATQGAGTNIAAIAQAQGVAEGLQRALNIVLDYSTGRGIYV